MLVIFICLYSGLTAHKPYPKRNIYELKTTAKKNLATSTLQALQKLVRNSLNLCVSEGVEFF